MLPGSKPSIPTAFLSPGTPRPCCPRPSVAWIPHPHVPPAAAAAGVAAGAAAGRAAGAGAARARRQLGGHLRGDSHCVALAKRSLPAQPLSCRPLTPCGKEPIAEDNAVGSQWISNTRTAADLFPFRKTVTGGLRKPVNHSFTGAGNQASTERWKGVLFPLPQFPLPIPNSPSSTSCGVSGGSPLKGCLVQAVCF